jgi:hypothetical protein
VTRNGDREIVLGARTGDRAHRLWASDTPCDLGIGNGLSDGNLLKRPMLRKERKDIGKELLDYYGRLVNPSSGAFDRSSQAFSNNSKKSSRGFDATHFDPKKRHINDQLTRALGDRAAAPYLIGVLDRDPVSNLNRYGLKLPPSSSVVMNKIGRGAMRSTIEPAMRERHRQVVSRVADQTPRNRRFH